MSTVVLAGLAALSGLGVLMIVAGLTGRELFSPGTKVRLPVALLRRVGVAFATGMAVAVVTGWVVGGVLAGLAVYALPKILGGKRERQAEIERTEAIASWTEMIRDSIVAASGLEEAIVATEPVASAPISAEVRTLVRRLDHQRLPDALVAFGNDLRHPSADLVVAALVIASRMEAADLSGLLSRLAVASRDEARMRIRVEVGRTRVRTATKVIVGVVVAAVVFLALGNREYLATYDTAVGQVVLAIVGAVFAFGGWLLSRMAEIDMPERFTARTDTTPTAALP